MDGSSRGPRGSVSKRLAASSYLLELIPDLQHGGDSSSSHLPHRAHIDGYPSQYQLSTRAEETTRHDFFSTQSLQWSGRDGPAQRFPPAAMTKCRLSRSKKRQPPANTDHIGTDSITSSKDHVIFAESPVAPGVPVVYRPPEERAANPDRLNLDRRHLTVFPILEGEERLRLLNLQHNAITRLQHLAGLRKLVFLDLYDNLIHEVSNLEGLLSLRVLMLGKNRIRKISGLQTLLKLDVLDLHGNLIRDIEQLNHLSHLRVLNLAGNDITCVSNLTGLQALTELNLRRNRITYVYEVDELPNLQRLFLSHNLIQGFDDISCVSQCDTLSELTLDGNPLANATDYRHTIIYHIRHLRSLDHSTVLDEERGEALAAAREEEEKLKELHKHARMLEHKEAAISAIRRAWENTHRDTMSQHIGSSVSTQSFVGSVGPREDHTHFHSASLPQLLPTYFVDHNGPALHLYGGGALEMFDAPPTHGKQRIEKLHFHFMEFNEIAPCLTRVATSYPYVNVLELDCTNMVSLEQLNALAVLTTPLHSLIISPAGNPITRFIHFHSFLLYRLAHLRLTQVNGEQVSDEEMIKAEQLFGRLGQATTSLMSQARLLSLIIRHRPRSISSKRASLTSSENMKKNTGGVCQEPLDKIALHHQRTDSPDQAQLIRAQAAQTFCSDLLSSTLTTHQKLQEFEGMWPRVLNRLIHKTLQEYTDIDGEMKNMLDNL